MEYEDLRHKNFLEKKAQTERVLRKTVTYEYIERPSQRFVFDGRSCLSKLPKITSYLRDFYQDEDLIEHDDVVLAIETLRGCDSRTIRKYIQLLLRHGYLVPASMKRSQAVYSRKLVQVRTKHNVSTREFTVQEGWKFYRFGPRAPKNYQMKLVPPSPSPLSRSGECSCEKNMCVLHRGLSGVKAHGSEASVEAIDKIECIEDKKKEEEVVLHTHILNTVIDKNTAKPALTPEEMRILYASRGNGG